MLAHNLQQALQRFARHPAQYPSLEPIRQRPSPSRLDQLLFPSFGELIGYRTWLDQLIIDWAHSVSEADLDHSLHYANSKGIPGVRDFHGLVVHLFNHQTHHRGQVTTLLSQAGVDVGSTDLLALIPNEPHN